MLFLSQDSPDYVRESLKDKGFNPDRIKGVNINKQTELLEVLNTEHKVGSDYFFSLKKYKKNNKIVAAIPKENRGVIIVKYDYSPPKEIFFSPKVDFYLSSLSNKNIENWKSEVKRSSHIKLYKPEKLKCEVKYQSLLRDKYLDLEAYRWTIKKFKDYPSKLGLEYDKIKEISLSLGKPIDINNARIIYGESTDNIYKFLQLLFKPNIKSQHLYHAFNSLENKEKWLLFVSSNKEGTSLFTKHLRKEYPLLYNVGMQLSHLLKLGIINIDFTPLLLCQTILEEKIYKLKMHNSESLTLIDYCLNYV